MKIINKGNGTYGKIRQEYVVLVDGHDSGLTPATLQEAKYDAAILRSRWQKADVEVIVAFFDSNQGKPTGYLRLIKGGKA